MGRRWSPLTTWVALAASPWAAPAVAAQLATPVDLTTTINGPALLPPADVDGDGDLDVLVTDAVGEALRWVQRTPAGPGPLLPLLRAPGGEALWRLADLDGDGDLDALALRRSPAQLHVFERQQGAFLPARREAAFPGAAVDLEVGDLDRDGVADVLVVLDGGAPAARGHFVLPGLGGGALGWARRFTPGSQVVEGIVTGPTQLADLDLDGDPDVLVLDRDRQRVVWFRNQGGPFAQGPLVVDDGFLHLCSVEARDLDGDGRLDLVTGGTAIDLDRAQQVFVHRGGSNGAFQPRVTVHTDTTRDAAALRTGDVDGDGDPDVLLADGAGAHEWFENEGGTLAPKPRPLPTPEGWVVAEDRTVDLDGDARPDLVVACATEQLAWARGLAGGDLGPLKELTSRVEGARAVAAADLDADGDLDLVVAGAAPAALQCLENLGGGAFGPATPTVPLHGAPERLLSGDFDGDGDLDLIAASFEEGWLDLLTVGPGGASAPVRLHDFASAPGGVLEAADVDGDGDLDLALSLLGQGDVLWFRGGAAGLEVPPRVLVQGQPAVTDLELRDIDADGDVDLVLTGPGFGGTVGWFPGQGAGAFGSRVAVPTINFQPRNVVSLDADGDGDLDLAIGGAGFVFPLLEWIPQVSPGQFGGADYVGSAVQGWADIRAADVDLDGDLDLVTTPRDASVEPLALTVYTAPFGGPPVVLERPQGVSSFLLEDVDADGDPDLVFTSERGDSVSLARAVPRGYLGRAECAAPAGQGVVLEAVGSPWRMVNDVRLRARELSPGSMTLFLASRTAASVPGAGGSLGTLCLGGGVGRFAGPGEAAPAGADGVVEVRVDLDAVPQPLAPRSVLAGETWRFQAWYRGVVGGAPTSNFSGSLAVEFR